MPGLMKRRVTDDVAETEAKKPKLLAAADQESEPEQADQPAEAQEAVEADDDSSADEDAEEESDEEEDEEEEEEEEEAGEKQDIDVECTECGEGFLFTVPEQDFYQEKGFTGQPKRCKDCRWAKKQASEARAQGKGKGGKGGKGKGKGGKGAKGKGKGAKGAKGKGKGKGAKGVGVCFAFQKGSCSYGDSCRFSHAKCDA